MRNLTKIADANAVQRQTDAQGFLAGDSSGGLAKFHHLVEASVFSTNVSADKILAYGIASALLDARAYYIQESGGDVFEGLSRFEVAQGAWLVRRVGFEDLWNEGRRFLYGAVNAGGMGTEGRFGEFCLIIEDPQDPAPDALAVFPHDSAQHYVTAMGKVNEALALKEATPWANRADLALLEHAATAASTPEDGWAALVCQPGHYLEVVRAGPTPAPMVTEARIRATLKARLDDLQARALIGGTLTPVETNETVAYDVLQEWRRTHGLTIKEVA